MDSNHRMSESKSDALPTWRTRYIWWTRQDSNPPPPACKAGALPDELLAQILASRQRLELRPRVLETHVLPLHQRDNQLLNALLPMRVIKHTVCDISVQVSSMCFITPGSYHLRYRHRLLIPRDALINSRCFECRQGRVPYALNKNPRVFSPGVLLEF